MNENSISRETIAAYAGYLYAAERSEGTREKYLRDVSAFAVWLGGRELTKDAVTEWKEQLASLGRSPSTVNAAISALNGFFAFLGREDCRVKFLKIQRRLFRDRDRELTQAEYERLVAAAREAGKEQLALLMETICATGIRVSEVRYITVEAARDGRAEIRLKGKIRTIVIPHKLAKKLLKFARANKIAHGEIFLTAGGKGLSRHQIWASMKAVCKQAGVEPAKVFPHNLRHLFATVFYRVHRDIVRLADLLGHSSINTTRIYLMTSGAELSRQLDRLGLVR